MKNFILLVFIVFLSSCTAEKQQATNTICPEALYSANHRVFISTEEDSINLNNISFRAKINNHRLSSCKISNDFFIADLSLLLIINPDQAFQASIEVPYYIALIDSQKNIIDIQYYAIKNEMQKNTDNSYFIETEIIENNNIMLQLTPNADLLSYKILIGFMLNKEKLSIIH